MNAHIRKIPAESLMTVDGKQGTGLQREPYAGHE